MKLVGAQEITVPRSRRSEADDERIGQGTRAELDWLGSLVGLEASAVVALRCKIRRGTHGSRATTVRLMLSDTMAGGRERDGESEIHLLGEPFQDIYIQVTCI